MLTNLTLVMQKITEKYYPLNFHLDEDVFHLRLPGFFNTSWSRPIYSSWPYVFKTFSKRLAKMSSRHLKDGLPRCLQDVFKTSSRGLAKTSSRPLQDLLQRYLQDVFKTYHQVNLFLLASLQEVLQRRLSTDGFAQVTLLRNLWSVYKICKSNENFPSFSFLLYYTFQWRLQRRIQNLVEHLQWSFFRESTQQL